MTFVFLQAGLRIANSTFGDLDNIDLRVALLMTNTTVVAVRDTANFVGDIVTLDEMDGSGYVRKVLAGEALATDATNDRVELTATATTWTTLGAGTRSVAGALVYKHVTNDADSPVLAWFDDGGFPKAATGSDFTVTWSSEGLMQLTCDLS